VRAGCSSIPLHKRAVAVHAQGAVQAHVVVQVHGCGARARVRCMYHVVQVQGCDEAKARGWYAQERYTMQGSVKSQAPETIEPRVVTLRHWTFQVPSDEINFHCLV
jgi:hypothetical protein